jgi:ubiquinone/menaquinone biosynthesis C-methylase UbiE
MAVSQPLAVPRVEREPHRDLDLLVLDTVKIQAWERLLFIGCGDGWIAEEAWRRALRAYAYGVDTSPTLVARAAELRGVPGKLEFGTWDGARLPCADDSFHRVVATFALQPPRDPAGVLVEMHRALQPGGHLYLLEVDRRSVSVPDHAAGPAFGAALWRAGFRAVRELARRDVALAWGERAMGAIVHAQKIV